MTDDLVVTQTMFAPEETATPEPEPAAIRQPVQSLSNKRIVTLDKKQVGAKGKSTVDKSKPIVRTNMPDRRDRT